MASRLSEIRENIHLIQSVGMLYPEEIVSAKEGDICIAYMFPRYSKVGRIVEREALKYAKEQTKEIAKRMLAQGFSIDIIQNTIPYLTHEEIISLSDTNRNP